eukprot:960514-Prymnesium_polylepis.1
MVRRCIRILPSAPRDVERNMMESPTTIHHTSVREYSIRIVSGHGYIRIYPDTSGYIRGPDIIRIVSGQVARGHTDGTKAQRPASHHL